MGAFRILDRVQDMADWNQPTFQDGYLPVWNSGSGKFVGAQALTYSTGSPRLLIQSQAANYIPLVAKGFTGQSVPLQEWRNSSDIPVASVSPTGAIVGSNLSGTNTGDQTITLTGDVTGSGTGSFGTTIGTGKVTNSMLAGLITASKLVGTDITTVGTIVGGIWNGTSIGTAYTDAKVKTVTGTANRLSIGGTSTDLTLDISGAYVGQNTITTLGTITTGIWNGTVLTSPYLPATVAYKNAANTFTTGSQTILTGADATVGLVIKGFSGTQTADLVQTQNSTGSLQIVLTSGREMRIYGTYTDANNYDYLRLSYTSGDFTIRTLQAGTGLNHNLLITAGVSLQLGGAGGAYWQYDASGQSLPVFDAFTNVGSATKRVLTSYACRGQFLNNTAASTVLIVQGATSQSGNMQEWQNSSGTPFSTVSENGYFTTRKNAAPVDAELAAGEAAYWFDSTNGAAKFMVKAKQADGTVVTGQLVLA